MKNIRRAPSFAFLFSLLLLLGAGAACAQQKLTKEALLGQAQRLIEGGRAQAGLDLIKEHPEFAAETDVMYLEALAYADLRDFARADASFQKQFDVFRRNGAESRAAAVRIIEEKAADKAAGSLAAAMYATALVSYGTAELVNNLRAVVFEKAGIPADKRAPRDLEGYAEFRLEYETTALANAEFAQSGGRLNEAAESYGTAIYLNPKNAAAYLARAKIYRRMKRLKLALADEAKAKRLAAKR